MPEISTYPDASSPTGGKVLGTQGGVTKLFPTSLLGTGSGDAAPVYEIELATDQSHQAPWWSPTFVATGTEAMLHITFSGRLLGQAWGWHSIAVGLPDPTTGRIKKPTTIPPLVETGATLIEEFIIGTEEGGASSSRAATVHVTGLTIGVEYTVEFNVGLVGGGNEIAGENAANNAIGDIALSSNEEILVAVEFWMEQIGVYAVGAQAYAHVGDKPEMMRHLGYIDLGSGGIYPYTLCCDPTPLSTQGAALTQLAGSEIAIFDFDSMALVKTVAKPGGMTTQAQHLAWRTGTDSVYVTDADGKVWVLDVSAGTWSSSIAVGGTGDTLGYISIQPDGTKAWISNRTDGQVRSMALPAHTLGTARTVGGGGTSSPRQNQALSDGSCWVACKGTNKVDHVDDTGVIQSKTTSQSGPFSVAVHEEMNTIFVGMQNAADQLLYHEYFLGIDLGVIEVGNAGVSPNVVGASWIMTQHTYHVLLARQEVLWKWPQATWNMKADGTGFPDQHFARLVVVGGEAP